MVLPTNYASLSLPDQLLVVSDLERTDRGETPYAGLTAQLSALAQIGADGDTDPPLPSGDSSGLWMGGFTASALYDDFYWMYDDGPGGANADCSPGGSGCWGHRDSILEQWPAGQTVLMGAAVASTSNYPDSVGEVYADGVTGPTTFSWSQETPYLTFQASAATLYLGASHGGSASGSVSLAVSGEDENLSLSIQGGGGAWNVATHSCVAAPQRPCVVGVTFTAPASDVADASLVISGPAGSNQVALDGGPFGGYWMAAKDGGVFNYGTGQFLGSAGGVRLSQPIVGMAATPDNDGYWLVAADGGIFSYGDAAFSGSTGRIHLKSPIVGMAADPATGGYWLVAADGGVFSFDAPFFGSMGNLHLNQPIVGMASTSDGRGYWLVGADGGVFSYGDAHFYGSTGNVALRSRVVGMAADPATGGYWLVAGDGGVFNYKAPFLGSAGGAHLSASVVGIASSRNGSGYWLVAGDGGVFNYGDATFYGSATGSVLRAPVVGLAG